MDNVVEDEIARINAIGVRSEHEDVVGGEFTDWLMGNPTNLPTNMKDAIKMFWNERLN